MKPLSDAQVIAAFGDPRPFIRADGTVAFPWEEQILATAMLPAPLPLSWAPATKVTRFKAHRRVAPLLTATFAELHATADLWATINDFGGCYNFRAQRGAKVLSRHSWGIAVDIDVTDNPMGKPAHVDPRTVKIFEAHGFAWGGNFSGTRIDPMHFEFADLTRLVLK